jgi:hypothetical protein
MSALAASGSWTCSGPFTAPRRESEAVHSTLAHVLAVSLGALLAFPTIAADVLCVAFLASLFIRRRMKPIPDMAIVFLGAVFISLIPALLVGAGPPILVWSGFAAMLAAFGFYLAGLNLGGSPALVRSLLIGICIGVCGETIIVAHDAIAFQPWFSAAPGRLAAFGFAAAGLLFTFGVTFRRLFLAAGVAACGLVFLASHWAGFAALLAWAAIAGLIALRSSHRRVYHGVIGAIAAALLAAALVQPPPLMAAIGGFLQTQVQETLGVARPWIPFGLGVARADQVGNGIVAVAMEFGVLGLAGFAGMIAFPFLRCRRRNETLDAGRVRLLLASFLLASVVFMFQGSLHQDRTFLLFLGVAAGAVMSRPRRVRPEADNRPVMGAVPALHLTLIDRATKSVEVRREARA